MGRGEGLDVGMTCNLRHTPNSISKGTLLQGRDGGCVGDVGGGRLEEVGP